MNALLAQRAQQRATWLWAGYIVALLAPLLIAALVQVSLRQKAVSLGYRLSHSEQQRDQLRGMIRKAELERAAGRTPYRLTRVAEELGLKPPSVAQLWVVGERGPKPLRELGKPNSKSPSPKAVRSALKKPAPLAAPRPSAKPQPPTRPQGAFGKT